MAVENIGGSIMWTCSACGTLQTKYVYDSDAETVVCVCGKRFSFEVEVCEEPDDYPPDP